MSKSDQTCGEIYSDRVESITISDEQLNELMKTGQVELPYSQVFGTNQYAINEKIVMVMPDMKTPELTGPDGNNAG